jgi:hypothetical protein
MASKREQEIKDRNLKIILAAFAGLAVGYYILNYVSTIEDIILGNTFYVIVGCIIMAVCGIVMFFALKNRYFPKKKKRKGSRPLFLKDQEKKE